MSDLTQFAIPWYLKYWKVIFTFLIVAGLSGYIFVLHEKIDAQTAIATKSHDDLIAATTQYKADVAGMTRSIDAQNKAITLYEIRTKEAEARAEAASIKSAQIRKETDRQVAQIMAQPKPKNATEAIQSLTGGISNLQWDETK